jgi:hypothetical protein
VGRNTPVVLTGFTNASWYVCVCVCVWEGGRRAWLSVLGRGCRRAGGSCFNIRLQLVWCAVCFPSGPLGASGPCLPSRAHTGHHG